MQKFAIVQEPIEYDAVLEEADGDRVGGLYTTYFSRDQDLFNLISRASTYMFDYEPGSTIPPPARTARITEDIEEAMLATLDSLVGGKTVRELCRNTNPVEMSDYFQAHTGDVRNLPLAKIYCEVGGIPPEADLLLTIVRARALQWKKHFRGVVNADQKVVMINFGAPLSSDEDQFLMQINQQHVDHKGVTVE